jgi:transcription elongation GreA/GreB family factor
MNGGKVFSRHDFERLSRLFDDTGHTTATEKYSMQKLKSSLSRCKPVDSRKIKANIVTMNSTFSLKNLGNGKKETYSLVFPQDCDGSKNKLSVFSIIGAEALGSAIGTIIKADPRSEQYFIIEDIIYQPEASGNYQQ